MQLFKGGTIVSGTELKKADLLVDQGVIKEVAESIDADSLPEIELIDVNGKLIFPGFIDAHTHFALPVSGTITADDFESGTKAAIAGGTTMIIDFATQYQGETLDQALDHWHQKADQKSSCDYSFHMAISDWNEKVSDNLQSMIDRGVTSFKLYMTYDQMFLEDKYIYEVLKKLKEVGGITGVHCENKGLIEVLIKEEKEQGHFDTDAHPRSRPDLVEAEAVDRLLKIAALADTPVIVVHLSTKAGYQEVCQAREQGQQVFLETCPQYLLLDDSRYQPSETHESEKYVISPPLRKAEDQQTLWEAIQQDQIQTLATDHCSFTLAQKSVGRADFTKIPNGMPGVENRPALIHTYGVKQNRIDLQQMCRLLSENAARLYGVYPRKGALLPGSDADLVIWNPDTEWEMTVKNQLSKCDYSPFEGFKMIGKPEKVYLRGQLAALDGKVVTEKLGAYVARDKWMDPTC